MTKFQGGDPEEMRASWERLDGELAAHFAAEERVILSRFCKAHPEEGARILREHHEIRKMLDLLGVDLDLHSLRAEAPERYIATLRKHAAYEDQLFYRWADEHLTVKERQGVLGRLLAVVHALTSK